MDRYRGYYAWQEAVQLGLTLYRLADDLPEEEQHLLASDLRRAAVEIPTSVAQNILANQPPDRSALIKVQVVMELIGRVYPALDTGDAETAVAGMAERLNDETRFMEAPAAPEPTPTDDDEDDDDDADEDDDTEVRVGISQES